MFSRLVEAIKEDSLLGLEGRIEQTMAGLRYVLIGAEEEGGCYEMLNAEF